jgi:murein DD-endopeptidase MepM/ murein hydrolase activator NlpD
MTRQPADRHNLVALARGAFLRAARDHRVLVAALALVLFVPQAPAVALARAATGSTATGSTAASPARWSWPLDGHPWVVRGFEPPGEPWLAGHRGVDLDASPGEPVRAAGDGRVSFAGRVGGVPTVSVTHPDGRRTTYQPVVAAVTVGDLVVRGAVLGRVSAAGSHCLPAACLHWGLRSASSYLDPLSLLGAHQAVRLLPVWSVPWPPLSEYRAAQRSSRPLPALSGAWGRW